MTTALKLDKHGKPRLSEADVTRQVCDFMAAEGWRGVRMNVGVATNLATGKQVAFHEKGMPDWQFIRYEYRELRRGDVGADYFLASVKLIWIEFKAPGKKLKPHQLAWHEAERARGALVKVVDHYETFRDWYRGVFS